MIGNKDIYIKTNLIPLNTPRRNGIIFNKTSVTVHNTANLDSTADNERNWLVNPSNKDVVSFNYAVDSNIAVLVVPELEHTNHSGTPEGNNLSISIEVCESGSKEKTYFNAVGLVADILHRYGWDVDAVRTHQSWNGKYCPRVLLPIWGKFIADIKETLLSMRKADESWKFVGLENLHRLGIMKDLVGWSKKIDENMPVWAVCSLLSEMYNKLNPSKIIVANYISSNNFDELSSEDKMNYLFCEKCNMFYNTKEVACPCSTITQ